MKLPSNVKSSKELKVTINAGDVCVACKNGDIIIKDKFPHKIKAIDSFWSISEGRLLMHLGKVIKKLLQVITIQIKIYPKNSRVDTAY